MDNCGFCHFVWYDGVCSVGRRQYPVHLPFEVKKMVGERESIYMQCILPCKKQNGINATNQFSWYLVGESYWPTYFVRPTYIIINMSLNLGKITFPITNNFHTEGPMLKSMLTNLINLIVNKDLVN